MDIALTRILGISYFMAGASIFFLDVVIFAIPAVPLWGLNGSLVQRLCLIGLFMSGVL